MNQIIESPKNKAILTDENCRFYAIKALSCLDYTNLNETASVADIDQLFENGRSKFGPVAAYCVYPEWISYLKNKPSDNIQIPIATVVNFPHGQDESSRILEDTKQAIQNGAAEIDIVFPYKDYLNGYEEKAFKIIEDCLNSLTPSVTLKVIVESGAFEDKSMLAIVAKRLVQMGIGFLKTSTGKIPNGADLESAEIFLTAIHEAKAKTGCKISGGVRTLEDAALYIQLAEDICGKKWVNEKNFRIGASQLLVSILQVLEE